MNDENLREIERAGRRCGVCGSGRGWRRFDIARPADRDPIVLCGNCKARFGDNPPHAPKPAVRSADASPHAIPALTKRATSAAHRPAAGSPAHSTAHHARVVLDRDSGARRRAQPRQDARAAARPATTRRGPPSRKPLVDQTARRRPARSGARPPASVNDQPADRQTPLARPLTSARVCGVATSGRGTYGRPLQRPLGAGRPRIDGFAGASSRILRTARQPPSCTSPSGRLLLPWRRGEAEVVGWAVVPSLFEERELVPAAG